MQNMQPFALQMYAVQSFHFVKKSSSKKPLKAEITMTFMPVMSVCKHPTDTAAHGSFFNR